MTQEQFHERIHVVLDRLGSAAPPHELFAGGAEDWHARARLAHFLAQMPEYRAEAMELFQSIIDADPNEELAQDVEEKVYALQGLSALEAREKETQAAALDHINMAIECAESTDFLYKYILRGEPWADRWNLMHKLGIFVDQLCRRFGIVLGPILVLSLQVLTQEFEFAVFFDLRKKILLQVIFQICHFCYLWKKLATLNQHELTGHDHILARHFQTHGLQG